MNPHPPNHPNPNTQKDAPIHDVSSLIMNSTYNNDSEKPEYIKTSSNHVPLINKTNKKFENLGSVGGGRKKEKDRLEEQHQSNNPQTPTNQQQQIKATSVFVPRLDTRKIAALGRIALPDSVRTLTARGSTDDGSGTSSKSGGGISLMEKLRENNRGGQSARGAGEGGGTNGGHREIESGQ